MGRHSTWGLLNMEPGTYLGICKVCGDAELKEVLEDLGMCINCDDKKNEK